MINDWLTALRDAAGDVFTTVSSASPWTLLFIGLALPFVALIVLSLYHNLMRIVVATYGTIVFRIGATVSGWKTQLVIRFRHWLPRRHTNDIDSTTQVDFDDFDDLDIAVLEIVAALEPGFVANAPELAERFRTRPARIQRCLDKLRSNKMLDPVIGSSEGFGNYRLSRLGDAFMASWARRTKSV